MNNQSKEQLYKYFNDSIQKEADIEIKAIRQEIDHMRHEAEILFERTLKDEQDRDIENAMVDIDREFQLQLTEKHRTFELQIRNERQALLDELIQNLAKRLEAFKATPAYEQWCTQKLAQIDLASYDRMIIDTNDRYLASIQFAGQIQKKSGLIGGFILWHRDGKLLIDESIETKIEAAKEWFYANSGWFAEPEEKE